MNQTTTEETLMCIGDKLIVEFQELKGEQAKNALLMYRKIHLEKVKRSYFSSNKEFKNWIKDLELNVNEALNDPNLSVYYF